MQFESFLINTLAALAMGLAIGLERQWRQHSAGLRTNALVALGAALFVSLSRMMDDTNSPTRIASYVVSGLGFLGGGVILRDGLTVKGLNTAATIWCTGAVGTLSGAGFPREALAGAVTVLAVNVVLRPIVTRIEAHRKTAHDVDTYYRLRVHCHEGHEAVIRTILLRHINGNSKMTIQGLSTEEASDGGAVVSAQVYATERCERFLEEVVARVSIEPHVTDVSWQKAAI